MDPLNCMRLIGRPQGMKWLILLFLAFAGRGTLAPVSDSGGD
jgi:hypothetical protein